MKIEMTVKMRRSITLVILVQDSRAKSSPRRMI
jgi:hypothetical protein